MKKLALLAFALLTLNVSVQAAGDNPVTPDLLPAAARQFIEKYFPKAQIRYATKDDDFLDKDYTVRLADQTKVEFDSDGQWKEVDCGHNAVPQALVPKPIAEHVGKYFEGESIVKIERERKGFEVELKSGLDIRFDRQFKAVEYDD